MNMHLCNWVLNALFYLVHSAPFGLSQSDLQTRQLNCNVSQRGFHLNLHCALHGSENRPWGGCVLKMRLSKALYVDPYELAIRQPHLNFTLAKPRNQSGLASSRLGEWLSWFTGSDPHHAGHGSFEQYESTDVPMNRSEVDVEGPEWLAEPMTLNLHPQSSSKVIDIPLHVRYHLPYDGELDKALENVKLAHPMLNCEDGDDFNTWDNMQPLDVAVPAPPTSDLLYVMPVTVLLLTVGVIVLLLA
ncbi:hypothetical protein P879_11389 [Paragonimus westermani]|uniref:Phosphatidylinositol-glycan biosynthesis class X protein n=1 Tax=Paragonimus westermani TaxID=34504 RepID=A0A8T0DBY1_9TREM|nr:hypothetical protein P879_11389 [Paragonimus westermani]